MNKFIKVLDDIYEVKDSIIEEIKQNTNRKKTSYIINDLLKSNYNDLISLKKPHMQNLKNIYNSVIKGVRYNRSYYNLFQSLNRVLKFVVFNEGYREKIFTEFRKPLKDDKYDKEIYDMSIKLLGETRERRLQRKQDYANKVDERNSNRNSLVPIYKEDILDLIDSLKNKIYTDKETFNKYEVLLVLLLATSSRPIELLKVSQFSSLKNKPNEIQIKGLAKNKNYDDVILTRQLIGLKSKDVLHFIDLLRTGLDLSMNNNKITDKFNKGLNTIFKDLIHSMLKKNKTEEYDEEVFKQQIKDFTSYKTRYISANIAYMLYGVVKNIPYESYIKKHLGHVDAGSTKSYLGINIKSREDYNTGELIDKVVDLQKDINTLNEKQIENDKIHEEIKAVLKVEDFNLTPYINTLSRTETKEEKINKVVAFLKYIKDNDIRLTQREIGRKLKYGNVIMTDAYKVFKS